jgi:hypothetical protein
MHSSAASNSTAIPAALHEVFKTKYRRLALCWGRRKRGSHQLGDGGVSTSPDILKHNEYIYLDEKLYIANMELARRT